MVMATVGSIVRPDALDYLSGAALHPELWPAESGWRLVPPGQRRLIGVSGVGVGKAGATPDPRSQYPTAALLAGLAGEQIPFALQVTGRPDRIDFRIGTWGDADRLDQRSAALTALAENAYPRVDLHPELAEDLAGELGGYPMAAIAYGVPGADVIDDQAPWDRLLRGLQGTRFAAVVLAEPVPPIRLTQLRDSALEDLRLSRAGQNGRTDLPLTTAYGEQLERLLESLERAIAVGGWRTGVYLLGDPASIWRLSAGWQGVFASGNNTTSPLRVLRSGPASRIAAGWGLPDTPVPAGPRTWQHPFLHQTLLTSEQLATIAHFPRQDVPGFTVRPAPPFAISRPDAAGRAVDLGAILQQEKPIGTTYRIGLDDLTRHVFVGGLTGSGKTNTLMHLLTEIEAAGIPFLVIEPAKTEYRELLGRPGIGDRLRVFTLGREQLAPLRINPFEVPDGIDVATHLDLLKAVFMGSFALWIPLPQVLEQCLVELYTERGWDFTGGRTAPGDVAELTVPTLGDLVAAVERTVPKLGYKGETTQEITASLTTRLNSLRRGSRGLMLDVEHSVPMAELLDRPTVIELEGLGDDADKAFVMGLLLVRLYEHRRAEAAARLAAAAAAGQSAPRTGRLSHVVVVEEAHRLLAQSHKTADSWNADPQGSFAEAFSQMLSEVRAYGQGIVIADQVPVRLAPDVLKNTNLKIAHRLVAGDDRKAMAAAMSMDAEQSRVLATLPQGRAAVFSEGDHMPVLVKIRPAKNLDKSVAIDDAAVATAMRSRGVADSAGCTAGCSSSQTCLELRQLAETPVGRVLGLRLLTTATVDAAGLDAVWPDVVTTVAARAPLSSELRRRVRAFAVHAARDAVARRAVQGRWPADQSAALLRTATAAIEERAAATETWLGATPARTELISRALPLVRRSHDPFPLCGRICPDQTCRYRDPVADVLLQERHELRDAAYAAQPEPATYVFTVAHAVAADVVAIAPDAPGGVDPLSAARWQATGCAAQLKFCSGDHPQDAARVVTDALASAGWQL